MEPELPEPKKEQVDNLINDLKLKSEYLIESILPAGEVHLLGGPSGSGKTRLLFDTLLDWEQGKDVFGYKSHPVNWVYVATDRSIESVHRTLASMGISKERLKIIPAFGKDEKTFCQIMTAISDIEAELAVIEAFGKFVEPPGRSRQVDQFLSACSAATSNRKEHRNGLTIIGVVESPKMKPSEKYELPRQRISGAASWGHFSDTVILVEPSDFKNATNTQRTVTICPRNSKELVLAGGFSESGHLILERKEQ